MPSRRYDGKNVRDRRLFATISRISRVQAAVRHLKGEKLPVQILLPVFIIDKENVGKVARTPEERPVPSWDKAVCKKA
jgi:hypothetical protein